MRRTDRLLPRVLFLVLLTAGLLLFFNGQVHSAEASESEEAEANVDKMMAGLSDEQVRELLIEELKKKIEEEEVGPQKMKGPAFILSRLLRVMSSQHDDSEDEVRALFSSLPTMGSDLYRVFVKL
jgi:hypothetical protein